MTDFRATLESCPLWQGQSRALSIERLEGGTTNFNFLVSDGSRKYVARFAQKASKLLGLDREREVRNTIIAGELAIAPQFVAHYPDQDLLIVEYIPGEVITPEIARRSESIREMARILLALHHAEKFEGTMNPVEIIHQYVEIARANRGWIPDGIDASVAATDSIAVELDITSENSCHLDLMMENIVKTDVGLRLLDWEYSACSDHRFDLAMLSVKGNFSEENDQQLAAEYVSAHAEELARQIQLMKAIVFLREATWALVQMDISTIDFDYRQYAIDHFKGCKEIVGSKLHGFFTPPIPGTKLQSSDKEISKKTDAEARIDDSKDIIGQSQMPEGEVAGLQHQTRKNLFLVCGISGAGKTTLIRELLKERTDITYMRTNSTRLPRPNEEITFEHRFVSVEEYYDKKRSQSNVWNHLDIYGAYYGIDFEEYRKNDSPLIQAYITIVSPLKEYIAEMRSQYAGHCKLIFMNVDSAVAERRILESRPQGEAQRISYDQSLEIELIRSQADIVFTPTNVLDADVASFIALIEYQIHQ